METGLKIFIWAAHQATRLNYLFSKKMVTSNQSFRQLSQPTRILKIQVLFFLMQIMTAIWICWWHLPETRPGSDLPCWSPDYTSTTGREILSGQDQVGRIFHSMRP